MEVTDAIRSYIQTKLSKLDKYFENPDEITANVLVKTHGIDQIVEVTIPIKKAILRSEENHKDLYAAIDKVTDKLERQIRKNKTRMNHKNNKDHMDVFVDFEVNEEEHADGKVVKRKEVDTKPMSEEEAILQMNLIGHEFFIFNNSETGNSSVLYKRKDGNYGIIEMK